MGSALAPPGAFVLGWAPGFLPGSAGRAGDFKQNAGFVIRACTPGARWCAKGCFVRPSVVAGEILCPVPSRERPSKLDGKYYTLKLFTGVISIPFPDN